MAGETHVLEECIKLHENNENKVTKEEMFSNNSDQNTKTAEKIQYIMKQIERAVPQVLPYNLVLQACTPPTNWSISNEVCTSGQTKKEFNPNYSLYSSMSTRFM